MMNVPENMNLTMEHLPPRAAYEPEMLSKEDQVEFDDWYGEHFYKPWDFNFTITRYCEQDVIVLWEACLLTIKENFKISYELNKNKNNKDTLFGNGMSLCIPHNLPIEERPRLNHQMNQKFRADGEIKFGDPESEIARQTVQVYKINCLNIHPFSQNTISGLAHAYFRAFGIQDDCTIPIMQDGGIPKVVSRASKEELSWLYYKQETTFPDLIYGTGKQVSFVVPDGRRVHVDGYSPSTGVVLEFLGDYFHGCPDHTKPTHQNLRKVTHQESYNATMARIDSLKMVPEVNDVIFIWVSYVYLYTCSFCRYS